MMANFHKAIVVRPSLVGRAVRRQTSEAFVRVRQDEYPNPFRRAFEDSE